ncbi:hypothetical protein K0M31_012368 [Melipona bicolor]|uniref:Uncharacterized protein n=1 Tax=Melipona bicolor TaxID=60889 RepID=A0AA40FKB2_9HYME|nr:hypothetical protein K0M31_012368 [Melipona bicolor]
MPVPREPTGPCKRVAGYLSHHGTYSRWWGSFGACAVHRGSYVRAERPVRGPKVCYHREGRPRIALLLPAFGQSVFSRVSFVLSPLFAPKFDSRSSVVRASAHVNYTGIPETHGGNLFDAYQRIQERSLCLSVSSQVSWGSRNAGEDSRLRVGVAVMLVTGGTLRKRVKV